MSMFQKSVVNKYLANLDEKKVEKAKDKSFIIRAGRMGRIFHRMIQQKTKSR